MYSRCVVIRIQEQIFNCWLFVLCALGECHLSRVKRDWKTSNNRSVSLGKRKEHDQNQTNNQRIVTTITTMNETRTIPASSTNTSNTIAFPFINTYSFFQRISFTLVFHFFCVTFHHVFSYQNSLHSSFKTIPSTQQPY